MEGLRGLAVLLVFSTHFRELFKNHEVGPASNLYRLILWLGDLGNVGVDLFFVLSGFLIYGALMKREFSFLAFMRRRVQRIYPTFLFMFVIYLLLCKLFPAENKIPSGFPSAPVYLLENLLFLPGIFAIKPLLVVAWSLSFEFFFYIATPALILIASLKSWDRLRRILLFACIGVSFAGFCVLVDDSRIRLLAFIPGMILYECLDSPTLLSRLGRSGEAITAMLVGASFLSVASYFEHNKLDRSIWAYIPVCFSFFLLTLYCLGFQGFFSRLFSWAPLRYLGNMSYSYYLIHALTLKGLTKILKPRADSFACASAFLMAFAATWVTATLLFVFVEKPLSLERVVKQKPDDPLSVMPMQAREGL